MTENFSGTVADCYEEFGEEAVYETPDGLAQTDISVIRQSEDRLTGALSTDIQTRGMTFRVQTAELDTPAKAGKIIFGGTTYQIQSPPRYLGDLRLEWALDTYPL